MRTTWTAMAAVLISAGSVGGQSAKPDASTVKEVVAAEKEFNDAMASGDRAVLSRILDDDCILAGDIAKPLDKAAFLAVVPEAHFASVTSSHDAVRVYGDMAIVVGTITMKPAGGTDSAQAYRYTTVFQKKQGRWVIVAEQAASGHNPGAFGNGPGLR